ncbi:MAG: ABC transporter ATP-binding protein [Clostridia bacterium]|nr:ABC transporter ATP-binding protein [Clostridia bacterium]
MLAIETTGLTKRYGNLCAVDQIQLEVEQGETFALLGVNGAGKSTAIKMLTCLTRPSGGEALVGGYSIMQQPEKVKGLIGVSPQETAVAPNLTVRENLEMICGIYGFSKEKTKAKTDELSSWFALEGILGRRAGKLSGGWQRRVSIAMALAGEPSILFLDEPTLGLDVMARHDLWQVMGGLKGKVTLMLTTHYMEEAETMADRIGLMKGGRLIGVGTAEELKRRAGTDRFEKAFIEIMRGMEK